MIINRHKLRIEWGDCDPAGIVYFPRYFEMFDVSTNLMMEAAGYPKNETLKRFDLVGWSLIDVGAKDGPEDNANLTKAYLANHSKTGGDL